LLESRFAQLLADSLPGIAYLFDVTSAEEPMEIVEVTVYYLEMLAPAHASGPAPRDGLTVLHVKAPTVPYYRALYNAVGKDYYWLGRRKLSDEALAAILGDPANELHVLHADGTPAGFAELDRRQPEDVELVQFGLMPGFLGQGLGKWFLRWTIDKAWSESDAPRRFWLHTCSLDHPAALPNYMKAGFVLFKQEVIQREL
jgi:GNAT superfamily N-acetyltransferase